MEAPETVIPEPAPAEPVDIPEPQPDPPPENLVGEAKRKQKVAEKQAEQLRERLEELEDRDRSEVEKAQKRAERAEQQATEYEGRVKHLERGGWLRVAAQEEGFNDPEDAIAFSDLDEVEDQRAAKRAVKDLASRKPHLLKAEDPTPPQIGRVLENGQPVVPAKNTAREAEVEQAKDMAAELKKLSADWQ